MLTEVDSRGSILMDMRKQSFDSMTNIRSLYQYFQEKYSKIQHYEHSIHPQIDYTVNVDIERECR